MKTKNNHTYIPAGSKVSFLNSTGDKKECTVLGRGRDRGNLTVYQLRYRKVLPDGSLMDVKFYLREHELTIIKKSED